jgi:NAD-dependent SIR2 family protein deacetylase
MAEGLIRTLLSINTSLKKKGVGKIRKDKIVYRIWSKKKDAMEFESEASTLNLFHSKWPKNRCPYCTDVYSTKDLKQEDKRSWVFCCPGCKSTLIVLKE